jgi:hypothetical protein
MASESAGFLPVLACHGTFKSRDECRNSNKKEAHTVSFRNITTAWFTIVFIPFGALYALNPTYYTHNISCTWSVTNHEQLFVPYDTPSKTLPFTIQLISVPLPIPTMQSACYLRRHKPIGQIRNKHVVYPLSDTSVSIHDSHKFRSSKVSKMTIGRVFLRVLPFSSVSIISSMLHTQLSLNRKYSYYKEKRGRPENLQTKKFSFRKQATFWRQQLLYCSYFGPSND